MSSVIQNIKLAQIRTDGGTQPRAALNEATVGEYAEAITEGAKLPPVVVYHDGCDHWLADGFHRYFAHKKIDALDINAEVHQGTQRDAVLHSVGANSAHGLRRTNDDKRKAVLTLLEDAEWAKWSQSKIAKHCSVTPEYVSRLKAKEGVSIDRSIDSVRTVERSGTTYEQNTANIGKKKTETPPAKKPGRALDVAPLPEEQMAANDELSEARYAITELADENSELRDRLAIEAMDASDEEKLLAQETIADLRQRVHVLEQENAALKASRDTYMDKCAEMQKQVNLWRRKAERSAA